MSEFSKGKRRILTGGLLAAVVAGGAVAYADTQSGDTLSPACRTSIKNQAESVRTLFATEPGKDAKFHVLRDREDPSREVDLIRWNNSEGIGTPIEQNPVVLMCGSKVVAYLDLNPKGSKETITTFAANQTGFQATIERNDGEVVTISPEIVTEELQIPTAKITEAGFGLTEPGFSLYSNTPLSAGDGSFGLGY